MAGERELRQNTAIFSDAIRNGEFDWGRRGSPRRGSPRRGSPRRGSARRGSARRGSPRRGSARRGSARRGRRGSGRRGSPRRGSGRRGSRRRGSGRRGALRGGTKERLDYSWGDRDRTKAFLREVQQHIRLHSGLYDSMWKLLMGEKSGWTEKDFANFVKLARKHHLASSAPNSSMYESKISYLNDIESNLAQARPFVNEFNNLRLDVQRIAAAQIRAKMQIGA